MAAVVPKGFDIVPDERLPEVPNMAEAPDPLDGIAEGEEAEVGRWGDGRPKIRRNLGGGQFIEGTYDDDGSWTAVGEISGDADLPEGFEPLSPEDQEALPSAPEGQFYDEAGNLHDEGSEVERDEEGNPKPQIGGGGAAYRGATSGLMLGFDDEFKAGVSSLANMAGRSLGLNETDPELSAGDLYRHFLAKERDEKDAAYDQHPLAYGAGFVPGAVLSAPLIGGKVAQGGSAAKNVFNLAGAGARGGAVSGAGNNEGDVGDLIGNVAEGATVGAAVAPLAQPVVNVIGGAAKGIKSALTPRDNFMNSGLDVLARQAPQDAAAMRATADEMVRSGVDPRLVDVVDESGRAAIRGAGSKMTPAREELSRHADEVYASAQGRVADKARTAISQQPGTARGVGRRIAEEQAAMGPRFDAVRDQVVEVTPEMLQAFSTAEGRSALRAVSRWLEPEDAAKLQEFIKVVGRTGADPDAAIRKQFPGDWDSLPEGIKASIRVQMGVPANPFEGAPLTVDIVDKFARILNKRAEDVPAMRGVAQKYSDVVRGPARAQYPDYDDALTEFAARARVGDAASGTGRFEGSDFLKTPSDEYAAVIQQAGREPHAVANEAGDATISEADAIAMRARDDIVDRATSGSGAQAMNVARQIAYGGQDQAGQAARNRILLGEEGADRLERAMRNEVRRVDNTRFIDPRTGSQTASREQDLGELGLDTAANVASSGKWAAVRAAATYLKSAGVRNVDAERLVRDAIDPRRTRDAINFLEQRGMERERARSLMRSISATLGGRLGGAASYDDPQEVRSGRSITNSSRRLKQGGGAGNGAGGFQP